MQGPVNVEADGVSRCARSQVQLRQARHRDLSLNDAGGVGWVGSCLVAFVKFLKRYFFTFELLNIDYS